MKNLKRHRRSMSWSGRLLHALKDAFSSLPPSRWNGEEPDVPAPQVYGKQWGDPETVAPLRFIRDRYLLPYVAPTTVALEIGPGGGRWTRYLLGCRELYVVDYYADMLDELRKTVNEPHMKFIHNSGDDFPGIPPRSIDFLFSFGTFVHLNAEIIDAYLRNMKPVLKVGANVVIHYSDKDKIMAKVNDTMADNDPERMRAMVKSHGYRIVEEDLTTMWHSALVRFTLDAE